MYNYQVEKKRLFIEANQVYFLEFRDKAKQMIKECGAFRLDKLMSAVKGMPDTWLLLACVDRLLELGDLIELKREAETVSQYKIYTEKITL
jgi:hypothetical protein